jgi:hypothetical protein
MTAAPIAPATIPELTRFISDEFIQAAGIARGGWRERAARAVFWLPARRFSGLIATLDADIIALGLAEAARRTVPRFVLGYEVRGAERIPAEGPLLIVANHPGAYDGFVAFTGLPRADVKVGASDSAFLKGLRAAQGHLIAISPDPHQRLGALRRMLRQLQGGGALYTYPGGLPAPDPDTMDGAEEGFAAWSQSLELLVRRVPATQIVIAAISGIVAGECMHYPGIRNEPVRWERQRLAEYAQLVQQVVLGRRFGLHARVTFSQPFTLADLAGEEIVPGIEARGRALLAEHMLWRPA